MLKSHRLASCFSCFTLSTLVLFTLGCDGGSSDGGMITPPTPTANLQDGVYQGSTSQGKIFEVTVRGKMIARLRYEDDIFRASCSSVFGCPITGSECVEITFNSPLPIDLATRTFFFESGSCSSPCPFLGCKSITGSYSWSGSINM